MIDASDFEASLREALPPALREHAGGLARLLSDAVNGATPPNRAQDSIATEPAYAAAIESLAGRRIDPLLSFGQCNTVGEVTVGDLAGGHVLKFHVLNVGGDVVRNLVVQENRRRVFVGEYGRLLDAYITPDEVFDRVQLDRFVGRTWLLDEVDSFLSRNDRGCFILEAEAGLGKTAFMAHMAKQRGYIHLFVEQARGQGMVEDGLRSLAAQLIRTWGLQPYIADGALPGAATRPDFL
jgi:hypothetical protein